MNEAISALVWCVIQVTVLTCGVAVVYLAARRLHPRAGAAAAGGGLLMVLALTLMVASPWPRWNFSPSTQEVAASTPVHAPTVDMPGKNSRPEGSDDATLSNGNELLPSAAETQPSYWQLFVEAINRPDQSPATDVNGATPPRRSFSWLQVIVCLLAVGSLLAAGRLVLGVASVRRLARSGREVADARVHTILNELRGMLGLVHTIAVRESDELVTPATVGSRRPMILLPASWREWNDGALRAAIAHELAHVAGRDYLAWLMARVAVVMHFYHPLVRWLASRLQLEQELAADMTAARLVGDSKQYLHSLAALALSMPANRMAGPARTLFPSRSLLVRRVEMLRTHGTSGPRRGMARYAALGIVALMALAAAGLRGPGIELATSVVAAERENEEPAKRVSRIGLEVVPPDAIYVLSGRVAEIAENDDFGPLIRDLVNRTEPLTAAKLTAGDIAEVMFIVYGKLNGPQNVRLVVRFTSPAALGGFRDAHTGSDRMKPTEEEGVWKTGRGMMHQLDAWTLVADEPAPGPLAGAEKPQDFAALRNALPRWNADWESREEEPVVAAVDARSILKAAPDLFANLNSAPEAFLMQTALPLFSGSDWAVAGLTSDKKLQFNALIQCHDEKFAATVRDTLQAQIVLLKNMADVQSRAENPADDPTVTAQIAFSKWIAEEMGGILGSAKLKVDGPRVNVSLESSKTSKELALFASQLLPPIEQARQAARQRRSINNLKNLSLAMLNYESTYRQFPAAASHPYRVSMGYRNETDAKSKYPHSWRVALLPYLDQQKLYEQYRFDEPWDSEANKKVLEQMPDVYRSPNDTANSTNTSYFVFTGPETVFPPDTATKIEQITDGTSLTISMVELKRPVPWTKPEDVEYASDKPMPKLETWTPGKLIAAFVDGHVEPLALDMDEEKLRDSITKGSFGGEGLGLGGEFENPTAVPAPRKP